MMPSVICEQALYARGTVLHRALRNEMKTVGRKIRKSPGPRCDGAPVFAHGSIQQKAEPCLQQVLRTTEKTRGPEDLATAAAASNLGELYKASGQYSKAAPMLDRAVKIKEKALGPDNPEVAQSLNTLAGIYGAQGEYAKAKPLLERTLKTFETNRPPTDPRVAQIFSDLGEVHRVMGDDAQAEPLLRRALDAKEKTAPDIQGSPARQRLAIPGQRRQCPGGTSSSKALKTRRKGMGGNARNLPSLNNLADHYREREPRKPCRFSASINIAAEPSARCGNGQKPEEFGRTPQGDG